MKIKNTLKHIAILTIVTLPSIFISINHSHSAEISIQTKSINPDTQVNFWEILNFFWSYLDGVVPESYQYIQLHFKWVKKDSETYKSLQKLVYLNRIENKNIFINQGRNINQYTFFKLAEKIFELNINYLDEEVLKEQTTTYNEI